MSRTLTPPAAPVKDQLQALWSDPVQLSDACIRAVDELLGHDVERLANATGISRRELNKQRERRDDKFGQHWLHRLCCIARRTREAFGPDRTAAAAHLFARACGYEIATEVAAPAAGAEKKADIALLAHAMREFSEASQGFAEAAEDGLDRREAAALIPDVDEALAHLQAIRSRLVAAATPDTVTATRVAGAITFGRQS